MMRLCRAFGVPACLFVLLGAEAPLPVRIAWTSVPTELAPILIVQKDLLDHQGVTYAAEPIHFSETAPVLRALAAGQIDLAPLAPNALGVAIQNAGLDDLRVVADDYQDGAPGHYSGEFMVRDLSPIRAVEDLRGKIVAVEAAGGMSEMALRIMLDRHGVAEPGEIDLAMAPHPSQGAMLEQGKIDMAALGAPFSYVLKSRGTTRTLFTLADALGSTDASMLVARAEFMSRNRAALDDFFEDYVRARRWFLAPAHRDEAVRIVAQASRVPADLLDDYLFTDGDYFRDRDARPDPAALQRSLDLLRQTGLLEIAIDAKALCDPSFVDEAVRRLK